MKIRIAENVRAHRKERKLTQEQLAEALGVTVGAVSKWESGASTPEIGLIVEMADFFETSVDVLLGYEWRSGGMGLAAERIKTLMREKRFSEGAAEAEKALKKYPNCFDVVYNSARLYGMRGLEEKHQKSLRRALELYQRACGMIDLCTDESIGEITLQNRIGEIYLMLGETDRALEQLKKNNFQGLNNSIIGSTLANVSHKPDEALVYLSNALWDSITMLFRVTTSYANVYQQKGDCRAALDILNWMLALLQGLKQPGRTSYLDRSEAMLATGCAELSVLLANRDAARSYLAQAIAHAECFDAAPVYALTGLRFYHGETTAAIFDSFGRTAMEGIRRAIEEGDDPAVREQLRTLWNELTHADSQADS